MTIKQFEALKEKFENLKNKKAKAEGKLETIEIEWDDKYGFTDIESANKKKNEIEKEIEKLEKKKENVIEKLENITDWEEIDE
jgi:adenylate kinase family enzyme